METHSRARASLACADRGGITALEGYGSGRRPSNRSSTLQRNAILSQLSGMTVDR